MLISLIAGGYNCRDPYFLSLLTWNSLSEKVRQCENVKDDQKLALFVHFTEAEHDLQLCTDLMLRLGYLLGTAGFSPFRE